MIKRKEEPLSSVCSTVWVGVGSTKIKITHSTPRAIVVHSKKGINEDHLACLGCQYGERERERERVFALFHLCAFLYSELQNMWLGVACLFIFDFCTVRLHYVKITNIKSTFKTLMTEVACFSPKRL